MDEELYQDYRDPHYECDMALNSAAIALNSAAQEIHRLEIENAELKRQLAEREGWQLVPKEPTANMRDHGLFANKASNGELHTAVPAYKAMLAAAPKQGD